MTKSRKRTVYGGIAVLALAVVGWGASSYLGGPADIPESRLATVERGIEVARQCAEHCYEPELQRLRANLLAEGGASSAAVDAAFGAAIDIAREQGQAMLVSRAARDYARFLRGAGRGAGYSPRGATPGPSQPGSSSGSPTDTIRSPRTWTAPPGTSRSGRTSVAFTSRHSPGASSWGMAG